MIARKCFISFKTEDIAYKKYIQENLGIEMIDKSLDIPIISYDEDYIIRKIRENYLCDSTVTIHLIGSHSSESLGADEQFYIKRELQASLYHGEGNTQNGILGVVLPSMDNIIYKGTYACNICNGFHQHVKIDDVTVIKEFSYNYYIPNSKCAWSDDDMFCVLVRWEDFKINPELYIEKAFKKRFLPIANQTRVRF